MANSDYQVHLICGSTGAGKTTYAKALAEMFGGVHFSIDQWMARLYWPDAATPIDPAWAMEPIERCNMQIWSVAKQVAERGTPVILDLGFTTKEQRAQMAGLAQEVGFTVQLHFIDASAEERWRRTQQREENPADEHRLPFAITRELFDYVEGMWERPDEDELAHLNGSVVTA